MRGKTIVGLVAAILVGGCFLAGSPGASSLKEGSLGAGCDAPMFVSEDLEGHRTSLGEILGSGKGVLLNFWGLRCGNCIEEIGHLNLMYGKFRGRVEFLGVNVDGAGRDLLRKMMPKMPHSPSFPVLPDPEFTISELFKMTAVPLSVVIGADGKILYRHEDFQPGDEKEIEEELAKMAAAGK